MTWLRSIGGGVLDNPVAPQQSEARARPKLDWRDVALFDDWQVGQAGNELDEPILCRQSEHVLSYRKVNTIAVDEHLHNLTFLL